MNAIFKILIVGIMAMFSVAVLAYGEPPSGWTLQSTLSSNNVKIYKKDNVVVYAQVIDMGAGAKIELKQTYVTTVNHYGRTLKAYKRDLVSTWYTNSASPISVVNGDYFFNDGYPTNSPLSFGVRSNGVLVDAGSDPTNDMQVEFFTGVGAYVTTYTASRMTNGPAQSIVGGFSPSKAVNPNAAIGRTGICTLSPSSPSRLVLIISAQAATQSTINTFFTNWRCQFGSQIMMDGSASSQASFKNGVKLLGVDGSGNTGRTVPQVIVIRNNGFTAV